MRTEHDGFLDKRCRKSVGPMSFAAAQRTCLAAPELLGYVRKPQFDIPLLVWVIQHRAETIQAAYAQAKDRVLSRATTNVEQALSDIADVVETWLLRATGQTAPPRDEVVSSLRILLVPLIGEDALRGNKNQTFPVDETGQGSGTAQASV